MIGLLTGNIIKIKDEYMIIDVNGIGFQVYMMGRELVTMTKGSKVTVYIHTHVREDLLQLFGFLDNSSLDLFKMLLSVSGLGPKIALNILSSSSPDKIVSAIINENKNFLKKLPGIGPKSAAKIILELKDKFSDFKSDDLVSAEFYSGEECQINDAIIALESLGYTLKEAQKWVQRAVEDLPQTCSTDQIVSYILKNLTNWD